MKHCIIHPSEYYEATCPSCDRERASGSLHADGSAALRDIAIERTKQETKWGQQDHSPERWMVVLGEEYGESCEAVLKMDWNNYRHELVQVAAVAIAAIEAADRALGVPPNDRTERRGPATLEPPKTL